MPTCRICQHTFKTLKFQTDDIGVCTRCVNTLNNSPEPAEKAEARLADKLARGMQRNAERDLHADEAWKRHKAQRVLADFDTAVSEALPGWITRLLEQASNRDRDSKIMRAHRRGLLRMSGFARRLEGLAWNKVRRQVLFRDGMGCKVCRATDTTLDVHHIVYLSHHGTNQQSNLITLCRRCHELEHGRMFDPLEQSQEAEQSSDVGELHEPAARSDASVAETYEVIDPETGEITIQTAPRGDGGQASVAVASNGSESSPDEKWAYVTSTEEVDTDLSSIQAAFIKTRQSMEAVREAWDEKMVQCVRKWLNYADRHRKGNEALVNLMSEATWAQVDPDKDFDSTYWTPFEKKALLGGWEAGLPGALQSAKEKQSQYDDYKRIHAALSTRFKALPAEAQSLYREVRDTCKELSDQFDRVLLANMQKALDVGIRRAECEHAKEIKRITDEGLKGQERDDAIAAANKKLKTAQIMVKANTAYRMRQMRAKFEANTLAGPYFPLFCTGEYCVTVLDNAGRVISFSRFEDPTEQRRFAEDVAKEKGVQVQQGKWVNLDEIRGAIDPIFVTDVETILQGADVPDLVKNTIWQRYLESRPDVPLRKDLIHRQCRSGCNADAMRAFARHLFHGGRQLANTEFLADLRDCLDVVKREAKRGTDLDHRARSEMLESEMERHIVRTMNKPSIFPTEILRVLDRNPANLILKQPPLRWRLRIWPMRLLVLFWVVLGIGVAVFLFQAALV